MNSLYILVGSRGIVGSQILQRLRSRGEYVITCNAGDLLECDIETLEMKLRTMFSVNSVDTSRVRVGVILAHRYRGDNNREALNSEMCITRDFTWTMSRICKSVRVVVLGSITGRFVDVKLPEAYHYSKDLQKSIARQSVRVKNLSMNVIELGWFVKYSRSKATGEYRDIMSRLQAEYGESVVPTVDSITDLCTLLLEMSHPPRGETIVYDGGLSLYQEK
jgi:hypothetical protein